MAVGGVSKNSCSACADLEYSGISTLGQETFVPTVKIPLSLSPIPHAEYTFALHHAFKNEKSRQRSGARWIGQIWARTTRGQGTARAAVPPSLGRPRGRGRPGRGRGRLELGGSRAAQDQPLPDSLSELLALVRSEVQLAQQSSTGAPALNPSTDTDAAGLDNQLVATSGLQG